LGIELRGVRGGRGEVEGAEEGDEAGDAGVEGESVELYMPNKVGERRSVSGKKARKEKENARKSAPPSLQSVLPTPLSTKDA
jgi:hypothetical protein